MPQTVANKRAGNSDKKQRRTNTKRSAVNKNPVSDATKLLKTAETKLASALAALEKATTRVAVTSEKAQVAAERARKNRRAPSLKAAKRAKEVVVQAGLKRQEAAASVKTARESVRDAKQRLKREQQAQRLIERKESAKQKAVAAFIKQWERDWDKKMKKNHKPVRTKSTVKRPTAAEITHDSAFVTATGHGA